MYVTVRVPDHPDKSEPEMDCEAELYCWVTRDDAPDVPPECMCGHRFSARQLSQIEHRVMARLQERMAG